MCAESKVTADKLFEFKRNSHLAMARLSFLNLWKARHIHVIEHWKLSKNIAILIFFFIFFDIISSVTLPHRPNELVGTLSCCEVSADTLVLCAVQRTRCAWWSRPCSWWGGTGGQSSAHGAASLLERPASKSNRKLFRFLFICVSVTVCLGTSAGSVSMFNLTGLNPSFFLWTSIRTS